MLALRSHLQRAARRLQPLLLGPAALRPPAAPPVAVDVAYAGVAPASLNPSASSLLGLFDGILLMAVPKKKTSYSRKRIRQGGQLVMRGPKLQAHMYMCPVCERMRAPHRVCDREDCVTYFKHRWF